MRFRDSEMSHLQEVRGGKMKQKFRQKPVEDQPAGVDHTSIRFSVSCRCASDRPAQGVTWHKPVLALTVPGATLRCCAVTCRCRWKHRAQSAISPAAGSQFGSNGRQETDAVWCLQATRGWRKCYCTQLKSRHCWWSQGFYFIKLVGRKSQDSCWI